MWNRGETVTDKELGGETTQLLARGLITEGEVPVALKAGAEVPTTEELLDRVARLESENSKLKAQIESGGETPPATPGGSEAAPTTELTNTQLKAKLTELGIKHNARANKSELEALLAQAESGGETPPATETSPEGGDTPPATETTPEGS